MLGGGRGVLQLASYPVHEGGPISNVSYLITIFLISDQIVVCGTFIRLGLSRDSVTFSVYSYVIYLDGITQLFKC